MNGELPEFSSGVSAEAVALHRLMWQQRGSLSMRPPAAVEAPAWRERANLAFRSPPETIAAFGTRGHWQQLAGVDVLEIVPKDVQRTDRVMLFFHGGGFVIGQPDGSTAHAMAAATRLTLLSSSYRKAPEHPFPAALDDAMAVYRATIERHGAANVVLTGVSAGAGLALSTILRARDLGLPMPAGYMGMSPWVDLARDGDSVLHISDRLDALGSYDGSGLGAAARSYAGSLDLRDPALSPLYADFSRGLCPALLITGTRDWFLSHCASLQVKLKRAGIPAALEVWEGMGHGFTALPIPEAREAVASAAQFIRQRLGVAN